MKFAFSTVACPAWDFATIAARAREYGYSGVEIRSFLNQNVQAAADVFKASRAEVKQLFKDAGIEIACLGSTLAMSRQAKLNAQIADDVRKHIDLAAEISCPLVKVLDALPQPGQSPARTGNVLGEWLAPLGDYACDRNVTLVVENNLFFRKAGDLWHVLEGANHPAILAAWNVLQGARAGEPGGGPVPTINSRIAYVIAKDARITPQSAAACKLGEGDAQVARLLNRLRGVGYKGYVTVEWDKALVPALADPELILPDALQKLKDWTKPPETKPKKAPAAAAPKKEAPAQPAQT